MKTRKKKRIWVKFASEFSPPPLTVSAQGPLSHFVFVFVQTTVVLLHHVVARSWALLPLHGLGKLGSHQLLGVCILRATKVVRRVVNVAVPPVSTMFGCLQHLRPIHNVGRVESSTGQTVTDR